MINKRLTNISMKSVVESWREFHLETHIPFVDYEEVFSRVIRQKDATCYVLQLWMSQF
jgi:hypothetical protein